MFWRMRRTPTILTTRPRALLLDVARDPSVTLYVTRKFFVSFIQSSQTRAVWPPPCSSAEALRIVAALLAVPGIRILPSPARAVAALMKLLQRRPVTGGEVFDLQIVATMQVNNWGHVEGQHLNLPSVALTHT